MARTEGLRILAGFIRLVCGVRPLRRDTIPAGPKVMFANHTSNLDFTVIWAALPSAERLQTRPVAGRDYWNRNKLSRFFGVTVFNGLLIERKKVTKSNNPVIQMQEVLDAGTSLIVFPEGTRRPGNQPGQFKSGLYRLAISRPDIPLIPVCLENLNRMMPKGTFFPIPLISRITFGKPLELDAAELGRTAFLSAARGALIELSQPPKRNE